MKVWPIVNNGKGIFGDFAVEHIVGFVILWLDGIFGADADAATTTDAAGVIDGGFALRNVRGIVGANGLATTAADAALGGDGGFAGGVHFHFAGA